jgi:hypothetical protein
MSEVTGSDASVAAAARRQRLGQAVQAGDAGERAADERAARPATARPPRRRSARRT